MQRKNSVEFTVYGRYALFTDPITRMGGEKFSYQIPTYQALKGILESVYWKPTLLWVIDDVRVMNRIQTQSQGIRPINYSGYAGGKQQYALNSLSIYTYLKDVRYQVRAHFEWNEHRPDLVHDRNENKHYFVAKRMIERGGRRDVFLGTRECQGYVEPCVFGEEKGAYDGHGALDFGLMVHGFDYPDETGVDEMCVRLWRPCMQDGVVSFISPQACTIRRTIKQMQPKQFDNGSFSGLAESGLLDGFPAGGEAL